jgi:hypothetical protein
MTMFEILDAKHSRILPPPRAHVSEFLLLLLLMLQPFYGFQCAQGLRLCFINPIQMSKGHQHAPTT